MSQIQFVCMTFIKILNPTKLTCKAERASLQTWHSFFWDGLGCFPFPWEKVPFVTSVQTNEFKPVPQFSFPTALLGSHVFPIFRSRRQQPPHNTKDLSTQIIFSSSSLIVFIYLSYPATHNERNILIVQKTVNLPKGVGFTTSIRLR